MSEPSYEESLAELMGILAEDTPAGQSAGGPGSGAAGATEGEPELYFASVDEFVREIIVPMYRRKVGARGSRRWSARWWTSAEAISRLDSLWRAWESLRLDGATGISTWWRDHADYHMGVLFDPDGPFGTSEDENRAGEPLPYEPPPPGLFPDERTA